jgi:hypothetical protein
VIRLEALQLQRLVATVLQQLHVTDTVNLLEVRELGDGSWLLAFEDHLPATRFPVFEISLQPQWTIEEAGRELRLELRRKLWICPLCQRRAEIRRVVDQEAVRIDCERCGRYEIESDLLEALRVSTENQDEGVAARLSKLAERMRHGERLPVLTRDNWGALADSTPPFP